MGEQREQALSETLAVIFIAILVIIATVLLIATFTGVMTKMLQKPAFIAVQAKQFNTTNGEHLIRLYHLQGDPVILNGTSQSDGVSIISLSLTTPSGGVIRLRNLTPIKNTPWRTGEMLYVYQESGIYGYSDLVPTGATTLAPGTWNITIQDDKVQVLLHSLTVTIR